MFRSIPKPSLPSLLLYSLACCPWPLWVCLRSVQDSVINLSFQVLDAVSHLQEDLFGVPRLIWHPCRVDRETANDLFDTRGCGPVAETSSSPTPSSSSSSPIDLCEILDVARVEQPSWPPVVHEVNAEDAADRVVPVQPWSIRRTEANRCSGHEELAQVRRGPR